MQLKTLVEALNHVIVNPPTDMTPDHLNVYLQARDELIELRNICTDGLDTHVSVVSWYAFSCIMNCLTYDEFGRIRKANLRNERRQTKLYRETCRDCYCEELTDSQIDGVADFLRDLWDDNENNNCHNPDGTLLRSADKPSDKHPETAYYETLISKLWSHIQEFHGDQTIKHLMSAIGLTDIDVDNLNTITEAN